MEQVISQTIEEELTKGLEEEAKDKVLSLKNIIKSITMEINAIAKSKYISTIKNDNKRKSQRLLKALDEKYVSTYSQDLKDNIELIDKITNLYFLTEQFFAVLGVIVQPRFLMTYDDGEHYFRKDFEQLLVKNASEYLKIEEDGHGRGTFGLRFKASSVIEQMKQQIENDKKAEQIAKDLHQHFIVFTSPYTRYSEQTGWKMNAGVAREAFERHLENLHKTLPNEFDPSCEIESEGRRWVMYRYSSGSDPYFTGPDTNLSQVKAENASLVSDIATVLNTAKYIIEYGESVSVEQLKQLLKTKGAGEIKTFSREIWNGLEERVQNEVLTAFGEDLGLATTGTKVGKNISIIGQKN